MKKLFTIFIILSAILFSQNPKQKSFQKTKTEKEAKFDIGIEKIFLEKKSCEIIVVLKNYGGIIPEEIFLEGKMKIKLENYMEIPNFFLKEIDKERELNSKKVFNYNTKIVLKNDAKITVFLENVNDKFQGNNKKLENLRRDFCKDEKVSLKKQKVETEEKENRPVVMKMETMPVFLFPVKNSNNDGKHLNIVFKIPEEYLNKKIKGVFYFTEKKSGKKYFLVTKSDPNNPYWFDNIAVLRNYGVYDPSNNSLNVWSYHRIHDGIYYWDEREVLIGKELPLGEYLINADLYNASGTLIKNYVDGPFRVVEMKPIDENQLESPNNNFGSVEEKTLQIDSFTFEKVDVHDEGINLLVGIKGKTKKGKPVKEICNGNVCGGFIRFYVYPLSSKNAYKVSEGNYEIKEGRLKVDPAKPWIFGTFKDPIRITIEFKHKHKESYRVQMNLKLNKSEEKSTYKDILVAEGNYPGSGEVSVDVVNGPLSPKNGDILISNRFFDIKWTKASPNLFTRILYSTDNGIKWKEILKSTEENHYNWLVPPDYTENGKLKFQWFRVSPEEGGMIFDESMVDIKIRGIRIVSPQRDSILKPNSLYRIKWESSNNPNLKAKLSYETRTGAKALITCKDNDGFFNWSIPNIEVEDIYLKAELLQNCPQGTFYGEDFFIFKIQNPKISFISPVSGETILSRTNIIISFVPIVPEGFSTSGKVSIYYKLDGENEWHEIASNLQTTSTLNWETPNILRDSGAKLKAVWNYYSGDVLQTYTSEINITIKRRAEQIIKEER